MVLRDGAGVVEGVIDGDREPVGDAEGATVPGGEGVPDGVFGGVGVSDSGTVSLVRVADGVPVPVAVCDCVGDGVGGTHTAPTPPGAPKPAGHATHVARAASYP
jgi:hypothetical protein